ncbi:Uncharacterised protein [uncultured archaeon]|nr:Uncharacterised protein [uncultured archaeon]
MTNNQIRKAIPDVPQAPFAKKAGNKLLADDIFKAANCTLSECEKLAGQYVVKAAGFETKGNHAKAMRVVIGGAENLETLADIKAGKTKISRPPHYVAAGVLYEGAGNLYYVVACKFKTSAKKQQCADRARDFFTRAEEMYAKAGETGRATEVVNKFAILEAMLK